MNKVRLMNKMMNNQIIKLNNKKNKSKIIINT